MQLHVDFENIFITNELNLTCLAIFYQNKSYLMDFVHHNDVITNKLLGTANRLLDNYR